MTHQIHLGISTCPNDTFAFHGLMNQTVDMRGVQFEIELLDVQQLNDRLLAGKFDVAKASFHTALMLGDETVVLPSGSALGFGVGPLLLSRHDDMTPAEFAETAGRVPVVLCPGATTTATLLYRLFFEGSCEIQQTVFSDIMPALQEGSADFGVCIHEGRFTWQDSHLFCVADLGEIWEQKTAMALPLGGILARRSLGSGTTAKVQQVIRDSIEYGLTHRAETLPTMKRYAAEFDDDVLNSHVDLYVNEQTIELGEPGRRSLAKLSELADGMAVSDGICYSSLEVFEA